MAQFDVLDGKIRSALLGALAKSVSRGHFHRALSTEALGSGSSDEGLDVEATLPVSTVVALEDGPKVGISALNVIPVTRGEEIVAFLRTRPNDALGAAPKAPAINFPNDDQIELFVQAKKYVEDNFSDDAQVSLFEFRPLQLKALRVSSDEGDVFVVYQIAQRISPEAELPQRLENQEIMRLINTGDPIQGIIE